MTFRSLILASAAAVFLWSCSDAAGPDPTTPGITVLAGLGSDTVQARPLQALRVRARGERGEPAKGRVIRFESVFSAFPAATAFVLLSPLTSNQFGSLVAATADDEGTASALLQMGNIAGEARVVVSVPELGLRDTVRFNVLPGAPVRVRFSVRDTAVAVGGSYNLSAPVVDRFNNPRTEQVTITNTTPTVCTVPPGGGVVSAVAMGRCVMTAEYGQTRDTARATAVLDARMVVSSGGMLALVSSNGSSYRAVLQTSDFSLAPAWSPEGTRLVIYEGDPYSSGKITIVDTTTGSRLYTAGRGVGIDVAFFGRFSPDGQWVYFSGSNFGEPISIWRMKPDATQLERVVSPSTDFQFSYAQRPSVSPDGQTVAFDVDGGLALVDVATRQVTKLNVTGATPTFSPDGQQLAFYGQSGSGLKVVNRDGTGVRSLSTVSYYEWQAPQWTSDGKWLLVRDSWLSFVNVADRKSLPLPFSGNYYQGAMRPPVGR